MDCNEVDGNYSDTLQNCTLPKSFSAEEGSWISSTVNFGMLFGAIMAGRGDVNFFVKLISRNFREINFYENTTSKNLKK